MRFRKSIKICKGVKLNLSKSGISTTVGVRGASVTFGKNGTYANYGIPGTGIYNRQRIDTPQSQARTQSFEISYHINDDASYYFTYGNGQIITDESIIRKAKANTQFKAALEKAKNEVTSRNASKVDEINDAMTQFVEILKSAPHIIDEDEANKMFSDSPMIYHEREFKDPKPSLSEIRVELEKEAIERINPLFGKQKKREQYVEENLPLVHKSRTESWEKRKNEYLESEHKKAEQLNAEYQKQYQDAQIRKARLTTSDSDEIESQIALVIEDMELPAECNFDFEYNPIANTIQLDLGLPSIDELPEEKASLLKNGQIKYTKIPVQDRRKSYIDCILGLSVFFSACIFNTSLCIKSITASGYTSRRNTDGDQEDYYVFSFRFDRQNLKSFIDDKKEAMDLLDCFENRFNATQTGLLKEITPFKD